MKKHTLGFLALSAMMSVTASQAVAETQQPTSVLVCRAHQCADASFSMTKGFLFNKIAQMLQNNNGKSVLICEADPVSHVCLNEGITIPAQTPFTDMNITLDGLNLVDEKLISGKTKLDVIFDYKIRANKTFPRCQLGTSQLNVNYLDQVELISQDVACTITETGQTSLNATYNIDYIDFDYGFIGAYYTIGVGEAVQGDKSGYALMRFTHRATSSTAPVQVTQPSDVADVAEMPIKNVPEILKLTIPTPPPIPAIRPLKTSQDESSEQASEQPAADVKPTEAKPAELKPTEVKPAEAAPQNVKKLNPTIIKTTVVEKTVITPDGKHQVTPPESRTILNDGRETTVIE